MSTKFNNLKKTAFLASMEATLGNITASCKEVGIDRSLYYKWLERDPKFKQAIDDLSEMCVDFAESHLKKQIKAGDTTATIFFLKTKGRHRGYTEKVEQAVDVTSGGRPIDNKFQIEIINRVQDVDKNGDEDTDDNSL